MKAAFRVLMFLVAAVGLTACGGGIASRNAPLDGTLSVATKQGPTVMVPKYDVQQVNVTVPEKLRVSEANMYYPLADIVWRGEARGNRHLQVKSILEEGLTRGTAAMHSGRPVALDVEVTRFHSLTEKTRYTFGGVHSVKFTLSVRDLTTGAIVDGPRHVVADVKGAGGSQAIAEEQMGRTMRVVITEHLAAVIARELSTPVSVPAGLPETAPQMAAVSQSVTPAITTVGVIY
ncbi:DUF6778 family protein [Gemmobacter serpentinus]|uniref:DUF6778 family protein n=1 Tax=Gemmobacter serpentinus TaxID=2652247 RepID=UPI001865804B|nr:DUF6778 family protein [Gemmobacter serpentinus]